MPVGMDGTAPSLAVVPLDVDLIFQFQAVTRLECGSGMDGESGDFWPWNWLPNGPIASLICACTR